MAIAGYQIGLGPSAGMFYASQQVVQEQAAVDSGRMTVMGRASGDISAQRANAYVTSGGEVTTVDADLAPRTTLQRVQDWARENQRTLMIVAAIAAAGGVVWYVGSR